MNPLYGDTLKLLSQWRVVSVESSAPCQILRSLLSDPSIKNEEHSHGSSEVKFGRRVFPRYFRTTLSPAICAPLLELEGTPRSAAGMGTRCAAIGDFLNFRLPCAHFSFRHPIDILRVVSAENSK